VVSGNETLEHSRFMESTRGLLCEWRGTGERKRYFH